MKLRIAAALLGTAAVGGTLAWRAAAQPPAPPPALTLETLMRGTGLEFRKTQHGNSNVFFGAKEAAGVEGWAVLVRYDDPNAKNYVMVYCSMLDRPDGYRFGEEVLRKALTYNRKFLGAYMALDEEHGDLDVVLSVPTRHLTAALLAYCIQDVALTCDANHNAFAKLAPAPATQPN